MDEKRLQELLQNPDFKAKLRSLLEQKTKKKDGKDNKDKKDKRPQIAEKPTYSLEVISVCNLCKSWTYKLFNMHKCGRTGFISFRVTDRTQMVEPRKRQIMAVATCAQCKHALMQRSKESLVNKLIVSRTEAIHEYWIMAEKIKASEDVDSLIA